MNASTILDRLDTIINRDDYTRSLGLAVLNELQKWIQNQGDWTFMETKDISQTLATGTGSYTVPTRFKRDIDVSIINTSYQQRFLNEWRGTQMDKYVGTTNMGMRPTHYFYFGGQLHVYPIPTASENGETIVQRCYAYLVDLTDSVNSSNELTDNHGNLLITGAARDIFNIFEDYDAAKIWDIGEGKGTMNFNSEWNAFLKKEAKKALSSDTPRFKVRLK